jgi:ribosomal-protein-alanine N-acetyltransferase
MPRNLPSRRVVTKLGFVEEGLGRKYLKINGVWEDHLHYALLNPDEE